MHVVDYAIIGLYLSTLIGIGLYVQRKASASIDSFFLGDNKIPWWALGASGMASNFDVSGTLIIAAFIYAIGLQGFYIEIRGGVVLVMAFFMIFMGKWNRRANVMTTAEWMEFRFGRGLQGDSARMLAAIANIVFAVWVVTYFAQGAGIFLGTLLGIDPNLAAVLMIALASVYTIASGLYGVVYTDVFQGVLIFGVIIYVLFKVMMTYEVPEAFSVSVPLGDGLFQSIPTTREAWTSVLPTWTKDLPGTYSQYNLFGLGVLFYLFRSTFDGMSAPGGYIIQRFYAARTEREAGLLSLFWIGLLTFRWPFVAAIAIMGISYGASTEVIANPEEVLPTVLMNLFPVGIKGILVAGLIAAAMSTFDSVVNSGAAYWVKDLYQRFLNPEATQKQLVWHSRISSALIVIAGTAFTFFFDSLNDIWGWLTMGLGVGLIVPQFLRWYWWRFNGFGYAGGTLTGMVLAVGQRLLAPELSEFATFFVTAGGTAVAAVAITLLTAPTDDAVLTRFFRQTRPFGFWRHIRAGIDPEEREGIRAENRRDIIGIILAVPWQLILFITAMVFMTKAWSTFLGLLAILVVLSWLLYRVWYRHLSVDTLEGS